MSEANKQLIEFMVDEYADAMRQQNAEGQQPPFNVEDMVAQLQSFRTFCKNYLNTHRPQQLITNIDGNYGVQLTNLKQYLVGTPIEELKGTMQPSAHVNVTGAQTKRDMQDAGALPITGNSGLIPPGAVDFTSAKQAQDMTRQSGETRYDTRDPRVAT